MIKVVLKEMRYGSCERVHAIIKYEHYNTIYGLAFLLRWEKVKNKQSDQCTTNYVLHANSH
jgi:hypothetical protein